MEKESEYRQIFLAEALEQHSELNRLLAAYEKDPANQKFVNDLFRVIHTLKGNAMGIGYAKIGELAHTIEDLFACVKEQKLTLDHATIGSAFKALDVLGQMLSAVKTGKEVGYRGIKTKLDLCVKNLRSPADGLLKEKEAMPATAEEETHDEGPSEDNNSTVDVSASDLVQVPVRKLDELMNLVGELIIEKDRLMATMTNGSRNEFNRLHRLSSDLQYGVMNVRLVQVDFLFNKFHRVVRDAAAVEGKDVVLMLEGTETEIDRNVLQVISDSLIHLVRNAIGHGLEKSEERKKAGKAERGTITLSAWSEADSVYIEVKDDGKGIDIDRIRKKAIDKGLITASVSEQLSENDIMQLIFEPGFSTADAVNAISGRGVGMDVVKRALNGIGGTIDIKTVKGEGSCFKLSLPASMAVKSTLLFELADQQYAIPLTYTESVILVDAGSIHSMAGGHITQYLGRSVSVIFLKELLSNQSDDRLETLKAEDKIPVIIVSYNGRTTGLVVDKLLQQKEIIEKPLAAPLDDVTLVGGVTIMGSGSVCLVLSVPEIMNRIFSMSIKGRPLKV